MKDKRSNEIPNIESRVLFKDDSRLREPVIIRNGKYLPLNDWYNKPRKGFINKLKDCLYAL